jgi:hypothetical protein
MYVRTQYNKQRINQINDISFYFYVKYISYFQCVVTSETPNHHHLQLIFNVYIITLVTIMMSVNFDKDIFGFGLFQCSGKIIIFYMNQTLEKKKYIYIYIIIFNI